MLKLFRPNGLPYLGERRDETIACRAALGRAFPKRKGSPSSKGRLKGRLKSAGSDSANGRTGFVNGLQRQLRKPKWSTNAL